MSIFFINQLILHLLLSILFFSFLGLKPNFQPKSILLLLKWRWNALIFIRRHFHESLQTQYLSVRDPQTLWKRLKDRYDHTMTVILPQAQYDWKNLRLQDFKSMSDYNSALFDIVSQLELCGIKLTDAELLEKTFSTFHASNIVLQQQYRQRQFATCSDLISVLLTAEQTNELLLKNHDIRPSCNTPKYTLVVFDMFRVFCKHNLTVSRVKCETWKRETRKFTRFKDKIVNCLKKGLKVIS